MRHVFVETNWVFAYAAPAHHKRSDAVDLLNRARKNEIQIHLPAFCVNEARLALLRKCQPRNEADAVRQFLLRGRSEPPISPHDEQIVRQVLDRFEQQVQSELRQLDSILKSIRVELGLETFPLNEHMLERALELSQKDLSLKPFDQAILAGILGRADELRERGQTDLCFCVLDADLQPWDRRGNEKQPLTNLYDEALIWVYGNFSMSTPKRPDSWPGEQPSLNG